MEKCLTCGHDKSLHQPEEFGKCMDFESRCKCDAYLVNGCLQCAKLLEENERLRRELHERMHNESPF